MERILVVVFDNETKAYEGVSALRQLPALSGVPVILLTGDPVDPNEIARLGATAGVQKPFDVPQLIEMIRGHVAART